MKPSEVVSARLGPLQFDAVEALFVLAAEDQVTEPEGVPDSDGVG